MKLSSGLILQTSPLLTAETRTGTGSDLHLHTAMSLTAASGFLLLFIQVVQGQDVWGVTYTSSEVCAIKGSTVELSCTYTIPLTGNGKPYTVVKSFWFAKLDNWEPVDLTTDSEFTGRVTSTCHEKRCTLRITDLRWSDSAQYKFRIITNQPDGRFTGEPGVTLSVRESSTDPALLVSVSRSQYYNWRDLKCLSGCPLPPHSFYVWYRSGDRIQGQSSSSLTVYYNYGDSYSCALQGLEDFSSPLFCPYRDQCKKVTYANRRICAPKGSTVDVSCFYYSSYTISSKFWFRPGLSVEWQSPSQVPGRVQVLDMSRRSVLRISNLTDNDSGEYRFRFERFTGWWISSPGTRLTVTELQVQVRRITAGGSNTEAAELRCHSSCSPAAPLSYVWFRNRQKLTTEEESSFTGRVSVGDQISCALKGHEGFPSPPVYAPELLSVSVSPSGETVEGSSVTLTCSTDANPAANYTWYKMNKDPDSEPSSQEAHLVFSSIQSSDSGEYYCEAENELGKRTSEPLTIDVTYPPRRTNMSVSPSAETVEGSSVTLNCSADANPAANYTWYKKSEPTSKGSGPVFTISDVRVEHSGDYFCEARNSRGGRNSTLHSVKVFRSMKSVTAGSISALFLVIILLLVILFIWKKKITKETSQQTGRPNISRQQINMSSLSQPAEDQNDLSYASVRFSNHRDEPVYSNISSAPKPNGAKRNNQEDEDDVDYTIVNFQSNRSSPQSKPQEVDNDPSAVYSTVMKPRRV